MIDIHSHIYSRLSRANHLAFVSLV